MIEYRVEITETENGKKNYVTVSALQGNFSTGVIKHCASEFKTLKDLEEALNIAFCQLHCNHI